MNKDGDLAFLLPDLRGGGAERVNLDIAKCLARRGYRVSFVLMQASGSLLEEGQQYTLVDLQAARYRSLPLALTRYLISRRPSVMIASMWPLTGVATLANIASRSKCRLILAEHSNLSHSAAMRGTSDVLHRKLGRFVYQSADGVVAVSQGVKDDLVSRTGLSPGRVSVIYNPVRELRAAKTPPLSDIIGFARGGGAVVVAVGALKKAKDYPTLLRAFATLRESRDARLLILGEGGLRGELEALVATLGLSECVRMPGFVPDPYPYLEQADLFVLSSAWEGLGNVIIEALVAGVPVVSTDCPSGPAEILENGRYGRLVPVGDPEALAVAMAEALDAPHDRDMLRRRGAEFSVERAADQYLALLDPGGELLTPA